MGPVIAVVLVVAVVCGFIGAAIGEPKRQGAMGFLLGFLFGPLGLLIVAVMQPNAVPAAWCPVCGAVLAPFAPVCGECGAERLPADR